MSDNANLEGHYSSHTMFIYEYISISLKAKSIDLNPVLCLSLNLFTKSGLFTTRYVVRASFI